MDSEALLAEMRRFFREEMRWAEVEAVTFEEAARRLSCSAKHVSRLVKAGQLMTAKVGNLRRIPVSELRRIASPAMPERVARPSALRKATLPKRFDVAAERAKLAARKSRR